MSTMQTALSAAAPRPASFFSPACGGGVGEADGGGMSPASALAVDAPSVTLRVTAPPLSRRSKEPSCPACGGSVGEADGGAMSKSAQFPRPDALRRDPENRLQDAVHVGHEFVVPEPQNQKSLPLDESVAPGIEAGRVVAPVLIAVEFDHQHRFKARKVRDKGADRVLTPKPQSAKLAILQPDPQAPLSDRHVFSHRARVWMGLSHAATLTRPSAADAPSAAAPPPASFSSPACGGGVGEADGGGMSPASALAADAPSVTLRVTAPPLSRRSKEPSCPACGGGVGEADGGGA